MADVLRVKINNQWVPIPALKGDSYTAGTGIDITNDVISNTGLTSVPNATSTVVGGITVRLSGSTLYIRNDGQQA